jgi:hypothetical protein
MIIARKGSSAVLAAVVDQLNKLRELSVGSNFHVTKTGVPAAVSDPPGASALQVTAPNATDLATSLVLVNQIAEVYNAHAVDALAHNSAVSPVLSSPVATDLATAQTLANEIKGDYGTHIAAANVHFNNDATNTIAAADASSQGTLNTLLNELKTDLNAHINGALGGESIKLVGP